MTTEQETQREYAWRTWPDDAEAILEPHEAPAKRCKQPGCAAPLWWGYTRANHRRSCFDIKPDGTRTGTSHFRTCRDRPVRTGR